MATRYGTRLFAAERAVFDLLAAQPWPSDQDGQVPVVVFGDQTDTGEPIQPARESVEISAAAAVSRSDAKSISAASVVEEVTIQIVIRTSVPGRSHIQVHDRLTELFDVVESAVRDATTGRPIPLDVECDVQQGPYIPRIARHRVSGPEGSDGYLDFDLLTHFHI